MKPRSSRLKAHDQHYELDELGFPGNHFDLAVAKHVLSFGTVEDTIAEIKHQILVAGEGGSFISAPGSDILGTVKPENLVAWIETVKRYDIYPLDKGELEEKR